MMFNRKLTTLALTLMTLFAAAACTPPEKDAGGAAAVSPEGDKKPAEGDQKPAEGNKTAAKPADGAAKPADGADKAAAEPKATGPVAKVNGVEIPREKLDKELGELKKRFSMFGGNVPPEQFAKFKTKIINRLVEEELINQKLKEAKVEVTDAEVDEQLNKHKESMPGGEAQFQAFLKRSGMSMDKIKDDIRQRIALKKFLNTDKGLDVTDADAKKHYDENQKRYEVKERVKASHILIKVKDDKAPPTKTPADATAKATGLTDADAKKKIDALYKEATKKGSDFAELAKKESMGPSAPRGGDLGEFTKGRMVPEFEEVAFATKPGTVSKPVKTKFGYHIIKVYEKKPAGTKSFDEVKEQIVARLEARKFRDAREAMVKELQEKGKVEVLDK